MENQRSKQASHLCAAIFSFAAYLLLLEDAVNTILVYCSDVFQQPLLPVQGLYLLEGVNFLLSYLTDAPYWVFAFLFSPILLIMSAVWFRANRAAQPNHIRKALFYVSLAALAAWGIKSVLYCLPFGDWRYIAGSAIFFAVLFAGLLVILWSLVCLLRKKAG